MVDTIFNSIDDAYLFYGMFLILLLIVLFSLFVVFRNYNKRVNSEVASRTKTVMVTKELAEKNDKINELGIQYNSLMEKYDELKKVKDKLYSVAYMDSLTSIPNKYSLIEQIDSTFLTLRKDEKFILVNINVDDFKSHLETIGVAYGDELIIDIAHRLKDTIGDDDYLVRNTGDDFFVFSQNNDEMSEFDGKIKKIQKAFSYPFNVNEKEISLTLSIGIAVAPDNAKNTVQLIENAVLATNQAKKNGKNTYVYYSDDIGEDISNTINVQSEITKAIANDEFVLYLQPVMNIKNSSTNIYESLIRWNNSQKGIQLPYQFLDIATVTGQISSIDELMVYKACYFIKEKMVRCSEEFYVSVNVSKDFLLDGNAAGIVQNILAETGVEPRRIIFEIKEKIVSVEYEKLSHILKTLNGFGIKICIDNFGCGILALNYLFDLSLYMIKIDKSVLYDASFEDNARKMLKSILGICRINNIVCVVEGVEIPEQKDFIEEIGFNYIQGYYVSEPKELKEFL